MVSRQDLDSKDSKFSLTLPRRDFFLQTLLLRRIFGKIFQGGILLSLLSSRQGHTSRPSTRPRIQHPTVPALRTRGLWGDVSVNARVAAVNRVLVYGALARARSVGGRVDSKVRLLS
jgi:hypothetical protein